MGWNRNIYSFPPIGSPDGGAHVTAAELDRFLRAVREGKVFCYEKERVSVGVSAVISHFPDGSITVTLLSNMEDGAWDPAWGKIHPMVVNGQLTQE